jgi:hypothetical protein
MVGIMGGIVMHQRREGEREREREREGGRPGGGEYG